jgi:hypothetical protein
MPGVVVFLCVESHQHFCNLTDMCQKPLACFSLHMGIVPKAYHRLAHAQGQVCWFGQICCASHPSCWYLSPGCQYEVGPAIPFTCHYSVYVGPDSVCSPSGYLSSHQYLLLNLSLFSYPYVMKVTSPLSFFFFLTHCVTTRLVVIRNTWLIGTRLNNVWVRGWIITIMLRLDHCW